MKNGGSLLRWSPLLLIAVCKIRVSSAFCCEIVRGPFMEVVRFDNVDRTDMSTVGRTVGSDHTMTRYVMFHHILDLLDFWQLYIGIISS